MRKFVIRLIATSLLTGVASLCALPAQAAIPFIDTIGKNDQQEPSLAPMLKQVTPAVVNISTKASMRVSNPLFDDPVFRNLFNFPGGMPQEEREVQAVGSGVIVDADKGYVLTNAHVVEHAKEVFVTLKDKRKIKAEVVGKDAETDLAVLKIKADNLTAIKVGDSGKLEVGDFVVAIGNPFGLGQTVTSGIVSALGRNGLGIEGYENFIQTDAAINPGNSGGALTDLKGNLIGINTAIMSRSGGNVGIGFAIPVSMAVDVMHQLIEHGSIERGQLGVHIQDITPEIASAIGTSVHEGALVAKVEKGSNAAKAGIKEGDVITSVNGHPVTGAVDLRNRVGLMGIGAKVEMEIVRGGKHETISTTIGKRTEMSSEALGNEIKLLKGATLADMPEGNPVKGVQVTNVNPESQAAAAGIEKGDIITSVNQKRVTSVAELIEAARQHPKTLLLNIQRGDAALFIVIQ
ncbi:MAG TPA: DegQ family serine endoprotease [Rickettsiales bacterium]|nr:DegQ family serine endoprotease [Rickettsiales bacterium]